MHSLTRETLSLRGAERRSNDTLGISAWPRVTGWLAPFDKSLQSTGHGDIVGTAE